MAPAKITTPTALAVGECQKQVFYESGSPRLLAKRRQERLHKLKTTAGQAR